MSTIFSITAWVVAGWAGWTLAEYVLHRWTMHEMAGRGILSREHLRHHAVPNHIDWTITILSWIGIALVSGAVTLAGWLIGGVAGLEFGAGFAIGYLFYEILHWRTHWNEPVRLGRAYELRMRHHHFHHHFGHPMSNHGVTLMFWDRVFGTFEAAGRVKVPRRLAPAWLMDDDGVLRDEYVTNYVLVGPAPGEGDARREMLARARVMANLVPTE